MIVNYYELSSSILSNFNERFEIYLYSQFQYSRILNSIFLSLIFYVILPMKTRLLRSMDLRRMVGDINKTRFDLTISDTYIYFYFFLESWKIICSASYRSKSIKF